MAAHLISSSLSPAPTSALTDLLSTSIVDTPYATRSIQPSKSLCYMPLHLRDRSRAANITARSIVVVAVVLVLGNSTWARIVSPFLSPVIYPRLHRSGITDLLTGIAFRLFGNRSYLDLIMPQPNTLLPNLNLLLPNPDSPNIYYGRYIRFPINPTTSNMLICCLNAAQFSSA